MHCPFHSIADASRSVTRTRAVSTHDMTHDLESVVLVIFMSMSTRLPQDS